MMGTCYIYDTTKVFFFFRFFLSSIQMDLFSLKVSGVVVYSDRIQNCLTAHICNLKILYYGQVG